MFLFFPPNNCLSSISTLGMILCDMYKTGNQLLSIVPYIAAKYFFVACNGITQLAKLLQTVNQFIRPPSPKLALRPLEVMPCMKPRFFFSPITSCPSEIPIPSEPH
jgi:hypothetical protein